MVLLQLFGPLLLGYAVWRLVKRLTATSPLADLPGPTKEHWLKGNYHRLFQDSREYSLKLAEKYGGAVKIHGLLGSEQLFISDPLALHHIAVREQDVYTETDMFIMGNKLIFGEGLIATLDEQHRKQRKMLNPVFSLANMRDLLPIIQPIADKLCEIFRSEVLSEDGSKEIDMLPWMTRGALEYICQAGLGYSFDILEHPEGNEYFEAIRRLSDVALRIILLRPFIPFFVKNFSLYWRNKIVDWAPIQGLRDMRSIVHVLDKTSKQILAEKRAALDDPTYGEIGGQKRTKGDLGARMKGRDIMSILLRANMSTSPRESMTETELLGQMNTIIFGGFDTTRTAICRVLYILAQNPDVQARLRSEIRAAKRKYADDPESPTSWKEVDLPYDILTGLPYLDAVSRETLRVHPPTSVLARTVRKDTILPLQYPIRSASGVELSSIAVPAGTGILISILASNHNKAIWGEDASEWKPERWLTSSGESIVRSGKLDQVLGETENTTGTNAKHVTKYPGVYGTMMTFLGGGRACIGFKFAEMELKQIVTTFLTHLHFSLPSSVDENGNKKDIYWKINGLQVPVVRPPAGDFSTPQVPLDVRLATDEDFAY
ncbi:hypothetical protein M422DRAFT_64043 [Sphaerobolus stellatus SS14]|nr:hypothetical protein M422DRAFT_64043 [Sphaerobolus stellatus SS14]